MSVSSSLVAEGCGISPRYISFLLQLHCVSYSNLIWEKRLKLAAAWLLSSKSATVPISEIAYSVGFKSTAHFSRMFKREFGMSPRDYRLCNEKNDAAEPDADSAKIAVFPVANARIPALIPSNTNHPEI